MSSKRKKIKVNFVDFWNTPIENLSLYNILSERFELEVCDQPDFLFYSCFGVKFLDFNCVRIFYTGENIRPHMSECDYAFSFDYLNHPHHHRMPLYALYMDKLKQLTTKEKENVETIFNQKKKFCNFIYSNNLATNRIQFFKKLSNYKRVDSGGKVLNNLGYYVQDKVEFLKPYKFTIAFENSSYPGYTTEKIFDAMCANTVPIYWGNPLVHRDFNTKSFINCHDYNSFDEVIEKVIELDNNDDLYKQYLVEPYFHKNEINHFADWEKWYEVFEYIFAKSNIRSTNKQWHDLLAKIKYSFYFRKPMFWMNAKQIIASLSYRLKKKTNLSSL